MARLAYIAIGLLLLTAPTRANAMYIPYRFFEMVGGAEVIVSGEIESLTDATYVLKIDRVIAGTHDGRTIEIRRFQDWACAQRYGAYEIGQMLVAFLVTDEHLSRKENRLIHSMMGAGSEAELPVVKGSVYLHLGSVGLPRVSLGRHWSLTKLPLSDLISAIEGHRFLYRVTLGNDWDDHGYFTTKLERIPPASPSADSPFRSRQAPVTLLAALQTYSRKSVLHRYLANSTEAAALHFGLGSIGWKLPSNDAQPEPKIVLYRGAVDASKATASGP